MSQYKAGKVPRLGVLLFSTPAADPNLRAFLGGLRDLGYAEGRNVAVEYRCAEGRPERVSELALQLASLERDVILVLGGDMVPFVKNATATIPVVMLTSQDPVEAGVVASFARPGGNLTGVAFVSSETAGKRLQFLKEAIPSLTRAAVLWSPDHPNGEYCNTEVTGRGLGIHIQSLEVRGPVRPGVPGCPVLAVMNSNRPGVVEFASKQRIPLVTGWGPWARAGGLMSYGPDLDILG